MDLVVGRVVKAHGVTGELVVDVRTDDPETRFSPGTTLRGRAKGGAERRFVVDSARQHSGRLLVRLDGVADRDAADALRGTLFLFDSGDLPPIEDPDEFYDHQLEGLQVRTTEGTEWAPSPRCCTPRRANCCRCAPRPREVLIPFVSAIVTSVSLVDQVIEIDPPEGLLELD